MLEKRRALFAYRETRLQVRLKRKQSKTALTQRRSRSMKRELFKAYLKKKVKNRKIED